MPRCDHCPMKADPGDACRLADDWPGWCVHIEKEATEPGRGDFWTAKAREELGQPPRSREPRTRHHGPFATNSDPAPGDHPPARPGELVIRGHGNHSGYGRLAQYLARTIAGLGRPTRFQPVDPDDEIPDAHCRSWAASIADPAGLVVTSPWHVRWPDAAVYSAWESTRLPARSVETYNRARVCIVPCHWNAEVFRQSGVATPIRVVPHGIDPTLFRPADDAPTGPFTVLTVAAIARPGGGYRKDVPGLIAAFIEALGDREDARLVLKIDQEGEVDTHDHPRILIDRSTRTDPEMVELYHSAHAFASMTTAEGWGMPNHEAMACGLPYIGAIHSAFPDYVPEGGCYPVEWDAEPATGNVYGGNGEWFRPRHDSMVSRLREAYNDREECRRRGLIAAHRAAEFTWDRSAREILAVLREFGLVAAPQGDIARQVRLSILRNKCPHGSKAEGCGCSGQLICAIGKGSQTVGGRSLASRDDCFACLGSGRSGRKVIALTAWNRPGYLRRAIDSLRACDGIGDYLILPHVEPGDDEVRSLIESIDFAECRPTWNARTMGCDANSGAAHRHAFEAADYAIYLDDDVVFTPDALRFYEWAADRYRDDPSITSATAYNRNREAMPPVADHGRVARRGWFHGLTFATWRDRFAMVDGLAVARPGEPGYWDGRYKARLVERGGGSEVYPILGRCDHIGLETSIQDTAIFTPEWVEANHGSRHWAGLHAVDRGPFRE